MEHFTSMYSYRIGTEDWDDYLGYWLKDNGNLTSIEIDKEICEIFSYRQTREGHPNPSKVICKNIFNPDLPKEAFDIVTLIGSAIDEVGEFQKCLNACFSLLKPDGYLMFMSHLKTAPFKKIEEYIKNTNYCLEKEDRYEQFPKYPFYICKIKKQADKTKVIAGTIG